MADLEQTQEVDAPELSGSGIWRIKRQGAQYDIDRATYLSQRYPAVETRMLARQAD